MKMLGATQQHTLHVGQCTQDSYMMDLGPAKQQQANADHAILRAMSVL